VVPLRGEACTTCAIEHHVAFADTISRSMMDRITAKDGVTFYRSSILASAGVPHGFSTRIGGVSQAPFDSLNLGNPNGCPVQDDRANIAKNYDLLHAAIGCSERPRAYVHQVHGDIVASALRGEDFDCSTKADAVVSNDPSRMATVRVADCVPVLLATVDGAVVAAVHAGWRGVVAGVVLRAAEQMQRLMQRDVPLLAVIGPGIGFDSFEVGPEVAAEFEHRFGGEAAQLIKPSRNTGKAMIDLRSALVISLRGSGLPAASIDCSDRCTFRDVEEFFSHRRDNGVTGRMAALIGAV
jgi:YfiH family protein